MHNNLVEFTLTIAFSLSYIHFYIYDEDNRWLLSYTLQRVMNMATNKNKHLTQDGRNVIAIGIVNGSSKKAIADNLGKDKSTIGKEIRAHRYLSHKSTLSLECENYAHCKFKRKNCTVNCPDYSKFRCKRRDRTPGACNGCEKLKSCRFDKYLYKPTIAYEEYRSERVESRTGINLTSSEAVELGNTIKPLLLKGHSPYQIIAAHPELGISEKTLYNYIEQGVFECVGLLILTFV